MRFRNPANGYIEERSAPWQGALFFGGIYFLAAGLFIPALLYWIIASCFWFWFGPPGTLLVIVMHVIFVFLANSFCRNSYLRKGWIEIGADDVKTDWHASQPSSGDEKQCPFCAEIIKAQAIKCRFCGSELPAHSR